jgi:hypothetical protein
MPLMSEHESDFLGGDSIAGGADVDTATIMERNVMAEGGGDSASSGAVLAGDHHASSVRSAKPAQMTAEEAIIENRVAEGIVIRRIPFAHPSPHPTSHLNSSHVPSPSRSTAPTDHNHEWTFPSTDCLIGTDRTLLETVQRCAKEQLGVDVSLIQSLIGFNTFGQALEDATKVRFDFLVKVHPMRSGQGYEVREGWEMKWVSQQEVWRMLSRGMAVYKSTLGPEAALTLGREAQRGEGEECDEGVGGDGAADGARCGNGHVGGEQGCIMREGHDMELERAGQEGRQKEERGDVPEVMSNVGHAGL